MEETEGLVEQPEAAAEELATEEGSMYGKFKDATSMLKAYKSLEAEFTRKSQRVSELEKMLFTKSQASEKVDALNESNENVVSSENANDGLLESEEWKARVNGFFENAKALLFHERTDAMHSRGSREMLHSFGCAHKALRDL